MAATTLIHDYETYCDLDLTQVGLDAYLGHPSAEALMLAWRFDDGPLQQWEKDDGPFPREVREALEDPRVIKRAFNAQFELQVAKRILKINTPFEGWRCTQAKAYSQSFTGNLDEVVKQLRLPMSFAKDSEGKALMKIFSMPNKVTKNQPHVRRTRQTDPEKWVRYLAYNRQDVIAEEGVERRLEPYPMLDDEWELWAVDQAINERGMPVNLAFVRKALAMADRRQAMLQQQIRDITGVENPNSRDQLLAWLREEGYWFDSLAADTVQKAITLSDPKNWQHGVDAPDISPRAIEVLKLRQWAARASTDKYTKLLEWAPRGRACFMFQFAGASRTNRWAGRGPQPQNLPRTPKVMEDEHGERAALVARLIETDDEQGLWDWLEEQAVKVAAKTGKLKGPVEILEALVGSVRSSFQAEEGCEFDICDLNAIESRVIGWLTGCRRLMKVFEDDLDPYKDFGKDLYGKPYDQVTKAERSNSKPAVLGAGYRMGGGDLYRGEKTGLWAYAESMGIDIPKEEAHRMVQLFRDGYPEIPQFWYALEEATCRCVKTGMPQQTGPVRWEMMEPYLTAILPSGRRLYYQYPEVRTEVRISRFGKPYNKDCLSYMGKSQITKKWERLESHGGLLIENLVQAIARDVLKVGILRAKDAGFQIMGHVHDEIIAMRRIGDNRLSFDLLRCLMRWPIHWAPGLLLNAAGFSGRIYRKD
jgi:DNA polymerase